MFTSNRYPVYTALTYVDIVYEVSRFDISIGRAFLISQFFPGSQEEPRGENHQVKILTEKLQEVGGAVRGIV